MIRISIDWKDGKKFDNLIRYIDNNLLYAQAQEGIRTLGHHTADKMRQVIDSERKRPDKGTHKLENSITAETISTTGGVEMGIGRISKMKEEAPYWEVLDKGGYIPNNGNLVPLGAFIPGEPKPNSANFRQGNWNVGEGKYTFRAQRPIEGIDYVGKSIRNLDNELKEMITKLGGSWLNEMEKIPVTFVGIQQGYKNIPDITLVNLPNKSTVQFDPTKHKIV